MAKTDKQLNDGIIKLENEMDELVIERNKRIVQLYIQKEIDKRYNMKKALLWALIDDNEHLDA